MNSHAFSYIFRFSSLIVPLKWIISHLNYSFSHQIIIEEKKLTHFNDPLEVVIHFEKLFTHTVDIDEVKWIIESRRKLIKIDLLQKQRIHPLKRYHWAEKHSPTDLQNCRDICEISSAPQSHTLSKQYNQPKTAWCYETFQITSSFKTHFVHFLLIHTAALNLAWTMMSMKRQYRFFYVCFKACFRIVNWLFYVSCLN